jgi:hypothetical protein
MVPPPFLASSLVDLWASRGRLICDLPTSLAQHRVAIRQVVAAHDQTYLEHIVEAIDRITGYTAGIEEAAFMADRKTQDAVTRNLEIIGEAAHNIRQRYPDFVASHPSCLGARLTVCAMP